MDVPTPRVTSGIYISKYRPLRRLHHHHRCLLLRILSDRLQIPQIAETCAARRSMSDKVAIILVSDILVSQTLWKRQDLPIARALPQNTHPTIVVATQAGKHARILSRPSDGCGTSCPDLCAGFDSQLARRLCTPTNFVPLFHGCESIH